MRWSTMRKRCGYFLGLIRSRPKCSQKKLDVLVMKRPIGKPKWATAKKAPEAADVAVPPGKKICPPFNASPRPYKMNCMP